jgi:hypothetical protein
LRVDRVTRVEAGANTSNVALRVVGGDENGSLESSEIDCAGEVQQQVQTTDPSSHQRERPISTSPQQLDNNTNVVVSPRWVLYSKAD